MEKHIKFRRYTRQYQRLGFSLEEAKEMARRNVYGM